MTEVEIIKWIVFGIMGVAVWFMKRTIDKNEERFTSLERGLSDVRDAYVNKADFKEFKLELRGMFEEIRQDLRFLHNIPPIK